MNIEQILYQIIMYLNCIFEIYLLYNFLQVLFPLYEDRKWMMWLEAFGCITAIFLINHLGMPLINTFCVPLIYLMFVWLIFRLSLKVSLPYCVFYYLILAISEFAFMYIYPLLGINVSEINLGRVLLLMIQDILRFMMIQLIKQMHHIPYQKSSYKYTKSLYTLPVAAMILLNGFIVPDKHPYGDILVSVGCIMLIVSNITIFSVVEKLLHAQKIIKDNEMIVLKTSLEKQHFQRMEEMNEEYAGYIHDMRHILKTIGYLSESENNEAMKRLSVEAAELLQTKSPLERKKYIDDPITDAIFSEREKAAKDKGIRFEADIKNGTDISFISDIDKIRIFGNLLDNALEAAAACDDGYISVDLHQGNESIVIFCIKNNFKHKNNKKGNAYLSIKDDKARHGLGLKNVEELSVKYNGIMKIFEEEETFTVTLILSNVQKTEKS